MIEEIFQKIPKIRLRELKKALENCDLLITDETLREEAKKEIRRRIKEIEENGTKREVD